jgi:small subunit ribosomal protein S20
MANIKSQKKRNLTNEKARLRNKSVRSALKTSIKKVHAAAEAGEPTSAQESARAACKLLDKAASKGVIHKNQAANRKSGVMRIANNATAAAAAAAAAAAEPAEE